MIGMNLRARRGIEREEQPGNDCGGRKGYNKSNEQERIE